MYLYSSCNNVVLATSCNSLCNIMNSGTSYRFPINIIHFGHVDSSYCGFSLMSPNFAPLPITSCVSELNIYFVGVDFSLFKTVVEIWHFSNELRIIFCSCVSNLRKFKVLLYQTQDLKEPCCFQLILDYQSQLVPPYFLHTYL